MKKLYLLLFIPFHLFAQIPDYYLGIDFIKTGPELEAELSALVIATHSYELIYTPEVWDALLQTDLDPENSENILLIYGFDDASENPMDQRTRDKDESCHSSNCNGKWVREHVYPKSLGNPNLGTTGPGSDAHHIRAIDSQKNNSRSNRRFSDGEGDSHIDSYGLFYPGDEWKGDVARMMMYMSIRYLERTPANVVGSGSNTYHPDMPDIFLEWNAEDPPSEVEFVRNIVLEEMQGNRNPFIDNPYLATRIWGGPEAENLWPNMELEEVQAIKTEVFPNPTDSMLSIQSNKEIESVSLYTFSGKMIFCQSKLRNDSLDLSLLPEGNYILLVNYENNLRDSIKIIVKK